MTSLNNDCIELIWKMYFKSYCVEKITLKICPNCNKQKIETNDFCEKCKAVEISFTNGFIMIYTALKSLQ
jgi:hypothetical protein